MIKAIRKTYKIKQFPFAVIFAKINQNFVFFIKMFYTCILYSSCWEVSSPGGIVNTTFGEINLFS